MTTSSVWQPVTLTRFSRKGRVLVTRIPRRLAVVGVAALLLTGCGGQLRPGAAALVGEGRITSENLREVVERSLADPEAASQFGADSAGFHRQALSRLINRIVLREVSAERSHVLLVGVSNARAGSGVR